jgi:hypothetical protein
LADKTNSLYGMICEIVRQETIYLRHYQGKVLSNIDDLNIGMCQISVPELGWIESDISPWCKPRQLHRLSVPAIGEWVEVYFLAGDRNRPVYIEMCNEKKTEDNKYCIPADYVGDPKLHIIFQSPESKKGIMLDDTAKMMSIDSENIEFIKGSMEPFVLGNQLNTFLTNFCTTFFNAHVHTSTAPGNPTSAPTVLGLAPSGILSTKIKGQ